MNVSIDDAAEKEIRDLEVATRVRNEAKTRWTNCERELYDKKTAYEEAQKRCVLAQAKVAERMLAIALPMMNAPDVAAESPSEEPK